MHSINKEDRYHADIRKPDAYRLLQDLDCVGDEGSPVPDPFREGEGDREDPDSTSPVSEDGSQSVGSAVTDGSGAVDAVMPDADGSDDSTSPDSLDGSAGDGSTGDGTADCPECGEDLGMTEEEAIAFVRANNGAWCDACGVKLVDGGSA